jgi:GIY-YIG catalytic domain-containing protein/NUMOD3 motif-containing protein
MRCADVISSLMSCTVYCIRHRATGREYVGITSRPVERRWAQHRCDARKNRGTRIARAIAKYGPNAFDWEVLLPCLPSIQLARLAEREIVSARKPAFNLTPGGESAPVMTPQIRAAIGRRSTGNTYAKGHTVSEVTRVIIASKLRGRKQSAETRAKYASRVPWLKGKTMSSETRAKISASKRGVQPSQAAVAARAAGLKAFYATPAGAAKQRAAANARWSKV